MAFVGAKPKPTRLHVIEGTFRPDRNPSEEVSPGGRPIPPKKLSKSEKFYWKRDIEPAFWLTAADSAKAGLWVALCAKMEEEGGVLSYTYLGHFRALGSELGFDPVSRTRLGTKAPPKKSKFDGLIGGEKAG